MSGPLEELPAAVHTLRRSVMAAAASGFQVVLAFAGRDSQLVTLPRDATVETLKAEAAARFGLTESLELKVRGSAESLSNSVVLCSAVRNLDTIEVVVRGVGGKRGSSSGSGLLGMASTAVSAAGSWAGSFFGAPPAASSTGKTFPVAATASPAAAASGGASVAKATGSGSAASASLPMGVAAAAGTLAAGEEDDEEDCSICLEPFVDAFPGAMLRCGHAFHAPCIREWGTRSAFCPLCRSPIEAPPAGVSSASAAAKACVAPPVAAPAAVGSAAAPAAAVYVRPHVIPLSPSGLPAGMPVSSAHTPGGGSGVMYVGSLQDNSLNPAALAAALEDTRRRLLASPEYTAMAAWIAAARKSHAAKVAGRYAKVAARGAAAAGSAAALSAAAAGTAVLKQAADSVIRNSPLAASVAALAGYQPAAPSPGTVVTTTTTAAAATPTAAATAAAAASSMRMLLGAAAAASTIAAAASGGAGAASASSAAPSGAVRCPRCMQVLVPPAGAPMFRCPCGSVLAR